MAGSDIQGSQIDRLLSLSKKEDNSLEIFSKLTENILSSTNEIIKVKFLENVNKNTWVEYNILLEAPKLEDSPEYLSYMFDKVSELISTWDLKSIQTLDTFGIQEVVCSESDCYYILLYLIDKVNENSERYDRISDDSIDSEDIWME